MLRLFNSVRSQWVWIVSFTLLGCQLINGCSKKYNNVICSNSDDCENTSICIDGQCLKVCIQDKDCEKQQVCLSEACHNVDNPACTEDSECQNPGKCEVLRGAYCVGARCHYPYKEAGMACDDDDVCTENDACDGAGHCQGSAVVCDNPPSSYCSEDNQSFNVYSNVYCISKNNEGCNYEKNKQVVACPDCAVECLKICEDVRCPLSNIACKQYICDSSYKDNNQCTLINAADGLACLIDNMDGTSEPGYCAAGACVECVADDQCTHYPNIWSECYEQKCNNNKCEYLVKANAETIPCGGDCRDGSSFSIGVCSPLVTTIDGITDSSTDYTQAVCLNAKRLSCNGYGCAEDFTCKISCTDSDDCDSLHYCHSEKCISKMENGQLDCQSDEMCLSGHCDSSTDAPEIGRCCHSGECCDERADCKSDDVCRDFICTSNAVGLTCENDGDCNSSTYCQLPEKVCTPRVEKGNSCKADHECLNNFKCVDGVCCAQSVCGTCESCSVADHLGDCYGVGDGQIDDTCKEEDGKICNGANVCLKRNGQETTSSSDCYSMIMADGVCCDAICDTKDSCFDGVTTGYACNLEESKGTCTEFTIDCQTYKCNESNSACLGECGSNEDCAVGSYCNKDGACVLTLDLQEVCDQPKADSADTSCSSEFCSNDGFCCSGECPQDLLNECSGKCKVKTTYNVCDTGDCQNQTEYTNTTNKICSDGLAVATSADNNCGEYVSSSSKVCSATAYFLSCNNDGQCRTGSDTAGATSVTRNAPNGKYYDNGQIKDGFFKTECTTDAKGYNQITCDGSGKTKVLATQSCSSSKPVCYGGACVACNSDGDCGSTKTYSCNGNTIQETSPVCELTTHTCKTKTVDKTTCSSVSYKCDGNDIMKTTQQCIAGQSTCGSSTTKQTTCSSTSYSCNGNDVVKTTQHCVDGQSTCGSSTSTTHCSGSTPACSGGSCYACNTNSQCPGSTSKYCVGKVPTTSSPQCSNHSCSVSTTSGAACAKQCYDGSCVECLTNADCSSAVNYTCNGNQIIKEYEQCNTNTHTCQAKTSVVQDCLGTTSYSCSGNDIVATTSYCSAGKSSCQTSQSTIQCRSSSTCEGSSVKTTNRTCVAGQSTCKETTSTSSCSKACYDGACVACNYDSDCTGSITYSCSGKAVIRTAPDCKNHSCSTNGSTYMTCNKACDNGACVDCNSSSDCGSNQICKDHKCESTSSGSCNSTNCPPSSGKHCENGQCVPNK